MLQKKQLKTTQTDASSGGPDKGASARELARAKAKQALETLAKLDGSVKIAAKESAKSAWKARQESDEVKAKQEAKKAELRVQMESLSVCGCG